MARHQGKAGARWALFRRFKVYHPDGSLYLSRLRIVQTPWFGLYLHRIHSADWDRALHDHPWSFLSLVLWGHYTEQRHEETVRRRLLSLAFRKAEDLHRISAVSRRLFTLVLVGRRRRNWGFSTPEGWVPWRTYLGIDSEAPVGRRFEGEMIEEREFELGPTEESGLDEKIHLDDSGVPSLCWPNGVPVGFASGVGRDEAEIADSGPPSRVERARGSVLDFSPLPTERDVPEPIDWAQVLRNGVPDLEADRRPDLAMLHSQVADHVDALQSQLGAERAYTKILRDRLAQNEASQDRPNSTPAS